MQYMRHLYPSRGNLFSEMPIICNEGSGSEDEREEEMQQRRRQTACNAIGRRAFDGLVVGFCPRYLQNTEYRGRKNGLYVVW